MSNDPNEHARLVKDSYIDRSEELRSGENVTIGGIKYTIIAIADESKTDYQGTAYRRSDGSGEVVIAHRGTEASIKDAATDMGMVFNGRNNQLDEAFQFTEQVMALAKARADVERTTLSISITGHSLGGTLAQITAARTGLAAHTFNAYGAAALSNLAPYGVDVQASYPGIVNHLRATDVVGAAAPHLGAVKTYAAPQDIESLRRGRYIGNSPLPDNPLLAADVSAHGVANFQPRNDILGDSVMSPINEARARAYAGPILRYRQDVAQGRIDLDKIVGIPAILPVPAAVAANGRLAMQVGDAIATTAVDKAQQNVVNAAQITITGMRAAAGAVGGAANEGFSFIKDIVQPPASPGLAEQPLYKDALGHLKAYNTAHGIPNELRTEQAAGAIAAAAAAKGLNRIDYLAPNDDGSKLIAVQGKLGSVHSKVIDVPTLTALNTPLADSARALEQAQAQREDQAQAQAQAQSRSQGHSQAQPIAMSH